MTAIARRPTGTVNIGRHHYKCSCGCEWTAFRQTACPVRDDRPAEPHAVKPARLV